MLGNNSVSYGQSGQQQPIYYGQNQIIYPEAVNKQQIRQVQQPSISYQVPPILQAPKQNNYQQIPQQIIHQQNQNQNIHQQVSQNVINPKNEYQNIYNQAPRQNTLYGVYQQNQFQNIYPNQLIYPQQPIQQNNIISNQLISNNQIIKVPISNINNLQLDQKEVLLDKRAGIWSKKEIDELYSYESAICKIKIQYIENGQIKEGLGTGCFCEIYDNDIPFKKALFTNNHVSYLTEFMDKAYNV